MMQHIPDEVNHIYLALGATDFRKQQNGLASLVALKFKLDPHAGTSVFLFCNKRHNAFILVTKALSDEMKFQWPKNQGEVRDITKRQLAWILEGLQVDQKKAHQDRVDTTDIIY